MICRELFYFTHYTYLNISSQKWHIQLFLSSQYTNDILPMCINQENMGSILSNPQNLIKPLRLVWSSTTFTVWFRLVWLTKTLTNNYASHSELDPYLHLAGYCLTVHDLPLIKVQYVKQNPWYLTSKLPALSLLLSVVHAIKEALLLLTSFTSTSHVPSI